MDFDSVSPAITSQALQSLLGKRCLTSGGIERIVAEREYFLAADWAEAEKLKAFRVAVFSC